MVAQFNSTNKNSSPFAGNPVKTRTSDVAGVTPETVKATNKQPTTVIQTVEWLLKDLGISPVPNCPGKAAEFGEQPKAPNYIGFDGCVIPVKWQKWQDRRPPKELLDKWFSRKPLKGSTQKIIDLTGVGAIAGLNDKGHYISFIDIDAKHFDNQEHCDQAVREWRDKFPILNECPRFRSPGGGYRFLIALSKKDEIFGKVAAFNFSSKQETSIGEILHNNGGHSLFPPSIREDGKAYYWEHWVSYPPVIDSYESIGLFPTLKAKDKKAAATTATTSATSTKKPDSYDAKFDQLIADINSNLSLEQAFNWDGHNFIADGDKLKGRCPWHDSSSGTSFYCERDNKGNLVYRCAGCDDGGNVFGYRYSLRYGQIGQQPKGKDFIEILKELGAEIGADTSFLDAPKKQKKQKTKPQINDNSLIDCSDITPELAILKKYFEDGNWFGNDDAYYRYNGIFWEHQKDKVVNSAIANQLEKCFTWAKDDSGENDYKQRFPYFTDNKKKSTFGLCQSKLHKVYQSYEQSDSSIYFRCFNNGVVDMRTGELFPHDKKYLLTTKLDVDYKPGSDCPDAFKEFIVSAYGEKFIPIFRALINMYVNPIAPYGYFSYFVGQSGSGKGTMIRFLGSLFDKKASVNIFSELMTPEGRHQHLTGVDFCCLPDVSSGFHSGLEAFYELVDNGPLNGRALYSKEGYSKAWNTRFAVASVHPIRVENSQGGWARRALIFPTKGGKITKDIYLEKNLAKVKGEVIGWALGLSNEERDRILDNYINNDQELKAIRREHEIDADSIKGFIDRCLRPCTTDQAITPDGFYYYYAAYCKEAGYKPLNLDNFKNRLKTAIPDFYEGRKQKRINGKQVWQLAKFSNIKMIDGGFEAGINTFTNQKTYICKLQNCYEGGLAEFEEFALKLNAVTSVTSVTNPPSLGLVTAETVTAQGFQEVSPLSPTSPPQNKVLRENSLEDKTDSAFKGENNEKTHNNSIEEKNRLVTLVTLVTNPETVTAQGFKPVTNLNSQDHEETAQNIDTESVTGCHQPIKEGVVTGVVTCDPWQEIISKLPDRDDRPTYQHKQQQEHLEIAAAVAEIKRLLAIDATNQAFALIYKHGMKVQKPIEKYLEESGKSQTWEDYLNWELFV